MDRFRKLVKAVGQDTGHEPHSYIVEEYRENGTMMPNIEIKRTETNMRMKDPTHTKYEVWNANDPLFWKMITEEEFNKLKEEWNEIRNNKPVTANSKFKKAAWLMDLIK